MDSISQYSTEKARSTLSMCGKSILVCQVVIIVLFSFRFLFYFVYLLLSFFFFFIKAAGCLLPMA